MTNEELLIQINHYCKRLGSISALSFKKESLEDILEDLKRMDKICIYEEKRND